jgi:FtsP/CotA-like multicopper oxidase with cupredoxin domain
MHRRRFLRTLPLILAAVAFAAGVGQGAASALAAQAPATKAPMNAMGTGRSAPMDPLTMMQHMTTPAMRQAAADARLAETLKTFWGFGSVPKRLISQAVTFAPNGMPDYLGIYPNYANSPLMRKFVDTLPGVGAANKNNLGQYIPIAVPDKTTYPGSDYYTIGLTDYTQQVNSDLPPTKFRGYVDLSPQADGKPHYLGPLIIAQKDRPVRLKFTNELATGTAGNLFLPVDTTAMGAGLGPLGAPAGNYPQNRAVIHLHGGATPWISDGTPHQWIVPAGEPSPYQKGVSQINVPDMSDPGTGSATYYYTNQQSNRLMFYHDHSYGMTRLNVYAGEAAGYLLTDPVEEGLISSGTLPGNNAGVYRYGVPLVIQDKTFVPDPTSLAAEDPTWDTANYGGQGSLWFPHVYMPNQNPAATDLSGTNPMGRWDYGPWFWPVVTTLVHGPVPSLIPSEGPISPGTPNPSLVPEAFMDTPLVNGTAYPKMTVDRKTYRFRILNACNDRSLNLQLYYVDPAHPTEVKMVPAVPHPGVATWPARWPTDGRDGGVPDPLTAGPNLVQIGTEGGWLPNPVVIPSTPVGYNYNRRDIVVLNIATHGLLMGPAERADVLVDFSKVPAGSKIILYNDAPAPVPAFDPRYDYYTGDPDQRSTGGANTTPVGYGPNTRTIMQFQVSSAAAGASLDTTALATAWPAIFATDQPAPIVPETAYGNATDTYSRIASTSISFVPSGSVDTTTLAMEPKAIQELFELDYGRMNATLGVELPFTNFNNQTTIPLGYKDQATEIMKSGDIQVWKITHNGVDTHAIHFHLFNVQVINRVGWDGAIRPPDPNELGWKETVRMNPLEDCIVAMRPVAPTLPFKVPDSVRPLDPTMPVNDPITVTNPADGNAITIPNALTDFGWEYVWHCHLLGHEENDMMRPIVFKVTQ